MATNPLQPEVPPRLRAGTALKSREEPYHRCLILSDPSRNGGYVVLVRVTTDDGSWPDRDCILTPRDWNELDHDSTVAYSTAKCARAEANLIAAIQAGEFELISSPPPEIVRKVIAAARTAAGMPPKAQRFLADV